MSGVAGPATVGGLTVERVVASAGRRIVVVAREPGSGAVAGHGRRLVSRIPWEPGHVDPELAPDHAPWDLPLVDLRPDGDEALLIVEALPDGDPAWGPGATRASGDPSEPLPPFVAELAATMEEAHARGGTAGPLHPSLVVVATDGALAGTAQRVLRAVLPVAPEGRAPLFPTHFWTPAELRREPPAPADDVFRLASMAWAWRHGEPPFGAGMDEPGGVLAGPGARDLRPADDLDRLLVAALDPDPARRPSAAALAAALRGPR